MPAPLPLRRRAFLASVPATLVAARTVVAAADSTRPTADTARPPRTGSRFGLANFSCHQHWQAVRTQQPGTRFSDVRSFFDYARGLGADGVQSGFDLAARGPAAAKGFRDHVEAAGGIYEADLSFPKREGDLAAFENAVKLARETGATVARAVLLGGRRYEVFASLEAFRAFRAEAARLLALAEPILRRHRLRLALENHKDLTAPEQVELLGALGSEWVGALVDTGNNLALLEDPYAVVEALAPFAASVHLKDMAVQPHPDGCQLSEVNLGTGLLDLPRIVTTLRRANPGIIFQLEMATRDPLVVPFLTPAYWKTFPDRKATELVDALALLRSHPPRGPVPSVRGKEIAERLALEETNNRACLAWMKPNLAGAPART